MNTGIDGDSSRGAVIAPLLVVSRYRGIIEPELRWVRGDSHPRFPIVTRAQMPLGTGWFGSLREEPEPSTVAEPATIGSGSIGRRSQR
jgi:hypothetical protein